MTYIKDVRYNVTYKDHTDATPYVRGCNIMARSFNDMVKKFNKMFDNKECEMIAAMKMN